MLSSMQRNNAVGMLLSQNLRNKMNSNKNYDYKRQMRVGVKKNNLLENSLNKNAKQYVTSFLQQNVNYSKRINAFEHKLNFELKNRLTSTNINRQSQKILVKYFKKFSNFIDVGSAVQIYNQKNGTNVTNQQNIQSGFQISKQGFRILRQCFKTNDMTLIRKVFTTNSIFQSMKKSKIWGNYFFNPLQIQKAGVYLKTQSGAKHYTLQQLYSLRFSVQSGGQIKFWEQTPKGLMQLTGQNILQQLMYRKTKQKIIKQNQLIKKQFYKQVNCLNGCRQDLSQMNPFILKKFLYEGRQAKLQSKILPDVQHQQQQQFQQQVDDNYPNTDYFLDTSMTNPISNPMTALRQKLAQSLRMQQQPQYQQQQKVQAYQGYRKARNAPSIQSQQQQAILTSQIKDSGDATIGRMENQQLKRLQQKMNKKSTMLTSSKKPTLDAVIDNLSQDLIDFDQKKCQMDKSVSKQKLQQLKSKLKSNKQKVKAAQQYSKLNGTINTGDSQIVRKALHQASKDPKIAALTKKVLDSIQNPDQKDMAAKNLVQMIADQGVKSVFQSILTGLVGVGFGLFTTTASAIWQKLTEPQTLETAKTFIASAQPIIQAVQNNQIQMCDKNFINDLLGVCSAVFR